MRLAGISFFDIKVYRKKFLGTVVATLLIASLCLVGAVAFFTTIWKSVHHQEMQDHFIRIEAQIATAKEELADYVDSLYKSRSLMADAKALFNADSEQEYVKQRQINSRASIPQIAYWPDNMKRFFMNGRIPVQRITISSETGIKILWYDQNSGDIHIAYEQRAEEVWEDFGLGDFELDSLEIRDPDLVTRRMGRLSFWCNTEDIFGMEEMVGCYAVLKQNEVIFSDYREKWEERDLDQAAHRLKKQGQFFSQQGELIYYSRFESSQYDCMYVSMISNAMLWKENWKVLVALGVTISVVAVGAIFISYISIYKEAEFLSHIMQMLRLMENGNFTDVEKLDFSLGKKNEYGMIAVALTEVSGKLRDYIKKEYVLKLKQQEAAMRALRTQINPHFLYNTLESIRAKALLEGDSETAEAIAQLGSLYRTLARCPEHITLEQEFSLLNIYLKLMSLRFGGNFVYSLELDEDVKKITTLSFWLQPLAENFFQHGIDRNNEFNLLIVEAHREEEEGVRIIMTDNGLGITEKRLEETRKNMYDGSDDAGKDIGLRNVYMRLSYFYGDRFMMDISNQLEGGCRISIFLPTFRQNEGE